MDRYEQELRNLEASGTPRRNAPVQHAFEKAARTIREIREGDGRHWEAVACAVYYHGVSFELAAELDRIYQSQYAWVGQAVSRALDGGKHDEISVHTSGPDQNDSPPTNIDLTALSERELAFLARLSSPFLSDLAHAEAARRGIKSFEVARRKRLWKQIKHNFLVFLFITASLAGYLYIYYLGLAN